MRTINETTLIFFVLLCFVSREFFISSVHGLDALPEQWWRTRPQPYFGNTPTNLTLISGQTAYLPCRVHMLGNRSVTWMRGRDLHILTVGLVTYSADDRFQILHSENTDDWTLRLEVTQSRDSGVYKCQVNSDPKIVRNIYLNIADKRILDENLYKIPQNGEDEFSTSIPGPQERYLQAGSALVLDCIVRHIRSSPTAVMWYHNDQALDYDSPRGGISLQLEKTNDQTTSRLHLSYVNENDSGIYTCIPVNAPKSSVSVHINKDELRAAVHQGGIDSANSAEDILRRDNLRPSQILGSFLLMADAFIGLIGFLRVL